MPPRSRRAQPRAGSQRRTARTATGLSAWRNRIVGEGEEAPDQLLAHPDNWRIHPQAQQDALAGVLGEVGWVNRIVVNRRTGHVVDGHLRVTLALRRSEPRVPVVYVDLDEAEERLILATLDPIAALAGADGDKVRALVAAVQTQDASVQALLEDLRRGAAERATSGSAGETEEAETSVPCPACRGTGRVAA